MERAIGKALLSMNAETGFHRVEELIVRCEERFNGDLSRSHAVDEGLRAEQETPVSDSGVDWSCAGL